MSNVVTTLSILEAVAGKLISEFPELDIYTDPTQQNVTQPCFFLQLRTDNKTDVEIDNRYMREFSIAITYLQLLNKTEMYIRFYEVLDKLELLFNTVEINNIKVFTKNKSYTMTNDALNYNFNIALRCKIDTVIEPLHQKLKIIFNIDNKKGLFL